MEVRAHRLNYRMDHYSQYMIQLELCLTIVLISYNNGMRWFVPAPYYLSAAGSHVVLCFVNIVFGWLT